MYMLPWSRTHAAAVTLLITALLDYLNGSTLEYLAIWQEVWGLTVHADYCYVRRRKQAASDLCLLLEDI